MARKRRSDEVRDRQSIASSDHFAIKQVIDGEFLAGLVAKACGIRDGIKAQVCFMAQSHHPRKGELRNVHGCFKRRFKELRR